MSALPPELEDALQFFVYRAQVGAALRAETWTPEEITGLMAEVAGSPDGAMVARVAAALRTARAQELGRARAGRTFARSMGEPLPDPRADWEKHARIVLAGAPPSIVRAAVGALAASGWRAAVAGLAEATRRLFGRKR